MRRHALLLLLASVLTFFLGLGRGAISDSDEAFYAEAAREMVESGNWLTPYYNYELRFQKPVLYYWLAAATFTVTGPGEVAARFPAAFSGLVLVLAAWAFGRRWCGDRPAFAAGLITAANFGYFALGRLALPDLPLAALMTITTWAGLEAAIAYGSAGDRAAASGDRAGWWWLMGAAAAAGLGFLMKGPVAVALPGLTILLATLTGMAGTRRWLPYPPRAVASATGVFLLVAAPWFAAMAREHGAGYLYRFFIAENVERFATDRYNEPRSILFYVPIVFGGLAPWSPFLLLWIPTLLRSVRQGRVTMTAASWRLVIWAAVPFVFYSLSIGKQPRYILPMLPPLAVLVARSVVRRLDDANGRRAIAWLATISGLLFVTLGVLLLRAVPLLGALPPGATRAAAGFIILAGIAVAAVAWTRPRWLVPGLAIAAIATLLSLHFAVFSARGSDPVERMALACLNARSASEPIVTHRVFVRNLVFYTNVRQVNLNDVEDIAALLARPERVLCVLRQQDLERLQREHGVAPRVLFSLRYFNTAAVRLRTLLWPDPVKGLEEVHLVTNR